MWMYGLLLAFEPFHDCRPLEPTKPVLMPGERRFWERFVLIVCHGWLLR